MSWFFGKKRHHRESPPDTPEEAEPPQPDDYIIIEKEVNPQSPTSSSGGGLYPYLGDRSSGVPPYPAPMSQNPLVLGDWQSYLHGIPFKLSKNFNNDFEIDRLRIDEIMSYFIRIKNEEYDYDFGMENGVINEMESGAK